VADSSDKYPLDASRSSDPVTPNAGSSGSGGSGGAGLGVLLIALPLLARRRQHVKPQRKVA
jgi:MYXO-CTERM domain-containing protein